jgi:hypothetical protein
MTITAFKVQLIIVLLPQSILQPQLNTGFVVWSTPSAKISVAFDRINFYRVGAGPVIWLDLAHFQAAGVQGFDEVPCRRRRLGSRKRRSYRRTSASSVGHAYPGDHAPDGVAAGRCRFCVGMRVASTGDVAVGVLLAPAHSIMVVRRRTLSSTLCCPPRVGGDRSRRNLWRVSS